MRISASVPRNPRDPTATIVVACTTMAATIIAALLIGGVSLMSHMAAVDTLIGKTDYYHRQLFYSFIALSFAAAILVPARESRNPLSIWHTFFPLSLRVLVACAGALVVWQVGDTVMWMAANGRGALQIDTVRDALFAGLGVFCAAAAMYAAFIAVGRRAAIIGMAGCAAAVVLSYRGHLGWKMSVGLVVIVGLTFLLRYLAEDVPSGVRPLRAKFHSIARFISAHYAEPLNASVVLGAALLVLGAGFFLSSGRDSAGVKPAEFAIWFLAIGLASRLTAQFNPIVQEPRRRRWPVVIFAALARSG